LREAVEGIFKDTTWVLSKSLSDRDIVERDEEKGHDSDAEDSLPANYLQGHHLKKYE